MSRSVEAFGFSASRGHVRGGAHPASRSTGSLKLRRGATSGGCLFTMVLFGVAGYVGIQVSEPYLRFYKFKDAAEQEARFAALRNDSSITKDLYAVADSLNLPEDAYHFKIIRTLNEVHIVTNYDDSWTVGWKIGRYTRPVHFDLDVEDSL